MARAIFGLAFIVVLGPACATPSATAGGPSQVKAQAGSQATAAAAAPEQPKLICDMERPVGSNIPRRVCRTPEQAERERQAAQDKIREMSRPGPKEGN
jgi:hypothetical protein